MPVGLAARPRAVALVVAAFAVAITGAVALIAAPWTPVAAGGALLVAAGFVVMAPCELQMATVLATVVGRAEHAGVRGTALRFTAGYLAYYVPVAIAIGALAHLASGGAWVLGAAGGVLALMLGLAALGDAGPAWLKRCRGPLYLLRTATGLLFWFHVLRPLPALVTLTPWQKLAYLLAGTLGRAVVAAVLIGAPHALYGASLENQRLAGAVMIGVEMPLAVGAALWVFLRAAPRGALRLPAEHESDDRSWLTTTNVTYGDKVVGTNHTLPTALGAPYTGDQRRAAARAEPVSARRSLGSP